MRFDTAKDSTASIREVAETMTRRTRTDIVFSNPSDIRKKGCNLTENSALDGRKLEAMGWKTQFDLTKGVEQTVHLLEEKIRNTTVDRMMWRDSFIRRS